MEKMEVEKKVEETTEQTTKSDKKVKDAKVTKWIKNTVEFTKTCEVCGAVMRGWAYREPFQFCPKCGAMAEKAE